jgi:hypothetical protein
MDRPPETGSQYSEGRSLGRVLHGDPHRQAQAARFLISYHEQVTMPGSERSRAALAAAVLLADLCDNYPEFMADQDQVDPETGHTSYKADPELTSRALRIVGV